jgi:hypothetical protein
VSQAAAAEVAAVAGKGFTDGGIVRSTIKFILLLLFAASVCRAQTVAVTGNLKDLGYNPATAPNTYVKLTLQDYGSAIPRIGTSGIFVSPNPPPFDPDSSGAISGTIVPNDIIAPEGTYYRACVYYQGVSQFCQNYLIASNPNPWNLNSAAPINPMPPYAANVVLQNPAGNQNIIQPPGTFLELNGVPIGSGGGGLPGGLDTELQLNCHSIFCGFANFGLDNSTVATLFTNPFDFLNAGPNPTVDARIYGLVSTTGFSTTATCVASSAAVTLAGSSSFKNGNGILLYGCGPAPTMATPTAPTVTTGEATSPNTDVSGIAAGGTGSSTYIVSYFGIDKNGGTTAAAPPTTITNGPAALGKQSYAVSTASLSGNTLTITTSATNGIVANSYIHFSGSSNAALSYWGRVSGTNSGTQFYINNFPTSGTISATGGTVVYMLANQMSFSALTGAYEYGICIQRPGDGSLHLVKLTYPSSTAVGGGWSTTTFDDYGATLTPASTLLNGWAISDANCTAASAGNDNLATTITGGGGTTSITVANAPSTSASGVIAKLDNGPALVYASNQTAGQYVLYIPTGSYPVNSLTVLRSGTKILQQGTVVANAPIIGNGGGFGWSGGNYTSNNCPQFGWGCYPVIADGTAYPAMQIIEDIGSMDHINFSVPGNYLGLVVEDSWSWNADYVQFSATGGNADNMGVQFMVRNTGNMANFTLDHMLFNTGPNDNYDQTFTPSVYFPAATYNPGVWSMTNTMWNRRGFYAGGGSNGLGPTGNIQFAYMQGSITPLFTFGGYFNGTIDTAVNDTSPEAIVDLLSGGTLTLKNIEPLSVETGGVPSLISGSWVAPSSLGANGYINGTVPNYSSSQFAAGQQYFDSTVHTNNSFIYDLAAPPASASTGSGGSLTIQTWSMCVYGVGYDGKLGPCGAASATTTSGNQTITLTWSHVAGAQYYQGWTSAGAELFTSSTGTSYTFSTNPACCSAPSNPGTSGLVAINGTGIFTPYELIDGYQDVLETAAPSNPASGYERWYADSASHLLSCLTSSGASCAPSGSGGAVTSVSGDGTFYTNSGSSGAVTLTLGNTGVGYGVWGNIGSGSGAPSYNALSSYPAAAFPTLNQATTQQAGSVANPLTINNVGAGSPSGSGYNGGAAVTLSYNSIGAAPSGVDVSNVGKVTGWNGLPIPFSTLLLGTNSGGQPVAATGLNVNSLLSSGLTNCGVHGYLLDPADSGCIASLANPMTTAGDLIVGGSAGVATRLPVNSGYVPETPVSANGATSLQPGGVPDGNAAAHVTTTPYAVNCQTTGTDRLTTIIFDSGASVVTLPDHTAAGCGNNMAFTLINESGGTLTVNRGGTDTINVTGTVTKVIGGTTFNLNDSGNASINNGEAGIWNARVTQPGSTVTSSTSYLADCTGTSGGCVPTSDTVTTNVNFATSATWTTRSLILASGDVIDFELSGTVTTGATNTTPAMDLKVQFGSSTLVGEAAANSSISTSQTANPWYAHIQCIVTTAGASGAMQCSVLPSFEMVSAGSTNQAYGYNHTTTGLNLSTTPSFTFLEGAAGGTITSGSSWTLTQVKAWVLRR